MERSVKKPARRPEPTTRAERRAHRTGRLLEQVMAAAASWAAAEYEAGLADGRLGTGVAHVEKQRSTAEAKFRDVAARLSAAVTPSDPGGGPETMRLRKPRARR